jgi:hypothetical protein
VVLYLKSFAGQPSIRAGNIDAMLTREIHAEHKEQVMSIKRNAVVKRIISLEQGIRRATEYLESGQHADCTGSGPRLRVNSKTGENCRPTKTGSGTFFCEKAKRHCFRQKNFSIVLARCDCDKPEQC